jgi:plasmid stability protein
MATLTIRNVSPRVVARLKKRARENGSSMEAQVRGILEEQVVDHLSAVEQIEQAWRDQARPTTAEEVDRWIHEGRR